MEKFEKFSYQGQVYVVFEDLAQLVVLKNEMPVWTLYEAVKFRTNLSTGETDVVEDSIKDMIEGSNWKKYPNPSLSMIADLNNAFDRNFSKEDFVQ